MLPKRNIARNFKKALLEPKYAATAFYKRLKGYASYKFLNGRSAYPEAFTLFLTHRCNLKCSMCGQWGYEGRLKIPAGKKDPEELPVEILENFLNDVASFKPHITLFGGEPLLYKDKIKLLKKIKDLGLHCLIITNGTLLKEIAKELVEMKIDEISISIDGPSDLHDRIRGVNGAFKRIIEGVNEINRLKEENKQKIPILNIVCTISHLNFNRLEEMLQIAKDIKANSLNFHHLIYIDEKTYEKHNAVFSSLFNAMSTDWKGFLYNNFDKINIDVLFKQISAIKNRKENFAVNFYPNFKDNEIKRYYTEADFISTSYSTRCLSPWVVAYIYPDGGVCPCLTLGYSAGNIKNESFMKIWNNKSYREYRRAIKKNKGFPICPRCTEFYRY